MGNRTPSGAKSSVVVQREGEHTFDDVATKSMHEGSADNNQETTTSEANSRTDLVEIDAPRGRKRLESTRTATNGTNQDTEQISSPKDHSTVKRASNEVHMTKRARSRKRRLDSRRRKVLEMENERMRRRIELIKLKPPSDLRHNLKHHFARLNHVQKAQRRISDQREARLRSENAARTKRLKAIKSHVASTLHLERKTYARRQKRKRKKRNVEKKSSPCLVDLSVTVLSPSRSYPRIRVESYTEKYRPTYATTPSTIDANDQEEDVQSDTQHCNVSLMTPKGLKIPDAAHERSRNLVPFRVTLMDSVSDTDEGVLSVVAFRQANNDTSWTTRLRHGDKTRRHDDSTASLRRVPNVLRVDARFSDLYVVARHELQRGVVVSGLAKLLRDAETSGKRPHARECYRSRDRQDMFVRRLYAFLRPHLRLTTLASDCLRHVVLNIFVHNITLSQYATRIRAATRIQVLVRSWMAKRTALCLHRTHVELQRKRRCEASVIIQKNVRAYRVRAYFYRLHRTATHIQSSWRCHRMYRAYASRCQSVVVVQRWQRAICFKAHVLCILRSIVRIQAFWRLILVRRRWHEIRDAAMEHAHARVVKATIRVQRYFRSYVARVHFKMALRVVRRAQRRCRARIARNKRLDRLRHAARTVQRRVRVCLRRKRLVRQSRAVVRIQTWARAISCRSRFLQMRRGANTISRSVRRYWQIRREHAARRLQSFVRTIACRSRHRRFVALVRYVQTWYRSRAERFKYLEQTSHVRSMQRAWRRQLEKRQRSAIKIQAFWRCRRCRRRYDCTVDGILAAQAVCATMHARARVCLMRSCAVLIQKQVRGYLVRVRWKMRRRAVRTLDEVWRRHSRRRRFKRSLDRTKRLQSIAKTVILRREVRRKRKAVIRLQRWISAVVQMNKLRRAARLHRIRKRTMIQRMTKARKEKDAMGRSTSRRPAKRTKAKRTKARMVKNLRVYYSPSHHRRRRERRRAGPLHLASPFEARKVRPHTASSVRKPTQWRLWLESRRARES